MIRIIPAIDIVSGHCVRLTKGDYGSVKQYDVDPFDMARRFEDCGVKRIHLVDLDGARLSAPANLKVLESIATNSSLDIEWGGGIAGKEALEAVFNAGAGHAIIGSIAALKPQLFADWLGQYGGERIILGADVKDGRIAVKGWMEQTALSIEKMVEDFLPCGLKEVICTDISRDGMLQGPSVELYTGLQGNYPELSFTVSGGISSMEDIIRLDELGLKSVIVGKAIYENRISLKDLELWSLKG